jgi:predicted porin
MNQYIRHLAHAAAIAAALTGGVAPAAETRGALYGDVRMSLDYTDDRTAVPGPAYTVTDNQSIWGLKFSAARGGVTVFGGYERFIDADDPPVGFPIELTRQAYLGMTSPCGTVKLGRHATAYSEAGRKLDPFYNTAVSGTSGVATAGSLFGGGNSHGTSTAFNGDAFGQAFVANHLAYRSPAFAGVSANVALFFDESGSADQDHDYGAGVEWSGAGVTVGAQFIDANGAQDFTWGVNVEASRLYTGYAGDRYGVGVSWERLDLPGASRADFTLVSGWYGVRDDTRIAVWVGIVDVSLMLGDSLRIGIFHYVRADLRVWAAARRVNLPATGDADAVTIGASYKFSLGFKSD